jgi:hypothetical protein
MNRFFSTTLVLLTLLAVTAGTAFAGSALELVHVANNGGGPTFTFRVVGDFSADELAGGFVQVQGGDDFPLYCSQTAPDEVVCHTSKKVGGHDVVVGFGGARFWVYVPEPAPVRLVCYPVFDVNATFPTFPTGYAYWRDECTEDQPSDFFSSFQIYYFHDAPSGWGVEFGFLITDPGILFAPFLGPGYYQ